MQNTRATLYHPKNCTHEIFCWMFINELACHSEF